MLAAALVVAVAAVVSTGIQQVAPAHAVTAPSADDDEDEADEEDEKAEEREEEDEEREDDGSEPQGEETEREPGEEGEDDDASAPNEDDARAQAEARRERRARRKRRRARRRAGDRVMDLRPPATPKRGESLNLEPESGTVEVTRPDDDGSQPLDEAASLPVGTIVDATAGAVTLTASASPAGGTQWATFSGATFQVAQPRTKGLTTIRLRDAAPASCRASKSSVFSSSYEPLAFASGGRVRKLWARGKGGFQTRGSHGVATVRGTTWMTANTCKGTLVRVKHGVVEVRDVPRHRTVVVRAGKQYLAKKRATRRPRS